MTMRNVLVLFSLGLFPCFLNGIAGEFNTSPQNLEATQGSDVTLPCRLTSEENIVVIWMFGQTSTRPIAVSANTVSTGRWQFRGNQTQGEYDLHVQNVTVEDEGSYRCQVNFNTRVPDLLHTLVVNVPVYDVTTLQRGTLTVPSNSNVTLHCEAKGKPTPTITWSKPGGFPDNTFLSADDGRAELILPNVDPSGAGAYECIAQNKLSRVSAEPVQLNILYKPTVTLSHRRVYTQPRDSVNITCNCTGNPRPNITWYKGETMLLNTPEDDTYAFLFGDYSTTLKIQNVSLTSDGNYTCTATNSQGTAHLVAYVYVNITTPFSSSTIFSTRLTSAKREDSMPTTNTTTYTTLQTSFVTKDATTTTKPTNVLNYTTLETSFMTKDATTTTTKPTNVLNYTTLQTSVVTKEATTTTKPTNALNYTALQTSFVTKDATTTTTNPTNALNYTTLQTIFHRKDAKPTAKSPDYTMSQTTLQKVDNVPFTKATSYTTLQTIDRKEDSSSIAKTTRSNRLQANDQTSQADSQKDGVALVAPTNGMSRAGFLAAIVVPVVVLVLLFIDTVCCFHNDCGVLSCTVGRLLKVKRPPSSRVHTEQCGPPVENVEQENSSEFEETRVIPFEEVEDDEVSEVPLQET